MGALSTPRFQRGYFLLVMLLFLVAGALVGIVNSLDASQYKTQHIQDTQKALALAKEALIGYAVTYDQTHLATNEVFGYLPCPDTDGDGSPNTTNDAGNCGVAGAVAVGLLPYKTLGLPDLHDDMGNCLWYAVSSGFKASATKPTPLNWDTQGQFSLQSGSSTVTPDDAQGGVAAVIIAPGAVLAGQARTGDSCQATPAQIAAYLDGANAISNPSATPIALVQGTPESSSNNDRLQAISPKEIFDRIRSRSDFTSFINNLTGNIRTALATLPVPDTTNHTQYTGKQIGYLPDLSASLSAADTKKATSWGEIYRYARCTTTGSYCFTIDGQHCDGVLFFAGSATTGAPRTSSQRTGNVLSAYIEDANSLSLLTTASNPGLIGNATYSSATPSVELRFCISPEPVIPVQTVDFSSNISEFAAVDGAQPLVNVNTVDQRIELGDPGTGSTPLYGCAWFGTALNLGEIPTPVYLRAYFRLYILDRGDGFTFTIADAEQNPTAGVGVPPAMCGGTGANAGYAGNNGTTNPIHYPKIALEFDRNRNASFGDTPGTFTTSTYRQLSFVYWGETGSPENLADDNSHGSGGNTSPLNPGAYLNFDTGAGFVPAKGTVVTRGTASGELLGVWTALGATQLAEGAAMPVSGLIRLTNMSETFGAGAFTGIGANATSGLVRDSGFYTSTSSGFLPASATMTSFSDVRIEMKRTYDPATLKATHLIKAYVTSSVGGAGCTYSDFTDLTTDLTCFTAASAISDTITIDKLSGAQGAPMKNIYLGFTNGQGSQQQLIYITNFQARISE